MIKLPILSLLFLFSISCTEEQSPRKSPAETNRPTTERGNGLYNKGVLITGSCVDTEKNTCSTFELLSDFVNDKKNECEDNGKTWGESACIMEGSFSACKHIIGNIDGQDMTWTLHDPSSSISKDSCESNGGEFMSKTTAGSITTDENEGDNEPQKKQDQQVVSSINGIWHNSECTQRNYVEGYTGKKLWYTEEISLNEGRFDSLNTYYTDDECQILAPELDQASWHTGGLFKYNLTSTGSNGVFEFNIRSSDGSTIDLYSSAKRDGNELVFAIPQDASETGKTPGTRLSSFEGSRIYYLQEN